MRFDWLTICSLCWLIGQTACALLHILESTGYEHFSLGCSLGHAVNEIRIEKVPGFPGSPNLTKFTLVCEEVSLFKSDADLGEICRNTESAVKLTDPNPMTLQSHLQACQQHDGGSHMQEFFQGINRISTSDDLYSFVCCTMTNYLADSCTVISADAKQLSVKIAPPDQSKFMTSFTRNNGNYEASFCRIKRRGSESAETESETAPTTGSETGTTTEYTGPITQTLTFQPFTTALPEKEERPSVEISVRDLDLLGNELNLLELLERLNSTQIEDVLTFGNGILDKRANFTEDFKQNDSFVSA